MMRAGLLLPFLFLTILTGCQSQDRHGGLPGDDSDDQPFAIIANDETVRFAGTEPFWNGATSGTVLSYATPDDPRGQAIAVSRFAGRGGLSISGRLGNRDLDLMITEGHCSDGMSDRRFPFSATLRLGEDIREGCAWTDRQPFVDTVSERDPGAK